jgi:hypothetical protein
MQEDKITQLQEKQIEALMENVRLCELDGEDGSPLYSDGDMRIGFKKKTLIDFLRTCQTELVEVVKEDLKKQIAEKLRYNFHSLNHQVCNRGLTIEEIIEVVLTPQE